MKTAGQTVRLVGHDSLDSTSAEAQRLAANGERGPLWIWARRQTEGRGRRGRAWVSEPGNLFATLLITLPVPAGTATQLSFVASLAVREAFERLLGKGAGLALKWPNDVLLGGEKIAGILIETCGPSAPHMTIAAVGCGLNLAHAPSDTRHPSTALARQGAEAPPEAALEALADAMLKWLDIWSEGRGFASIRRAWTNHAYRLGAEIAVSAGGEPVLGTFHGLADDGALVLMDARDRQLRRFHAGEVSLSFPVAPGALG